MDLGIAYRTNGDYEQAVTYSIVNENPDPISGKRKDLPHDLEPNLGYLLQIGHQLVAINA